MKEIKSFVENIVEKEKAIRFLKEKGVLVEFTENLNLFHGRVNLDDKNFFVKSDFDNSGHTLGHYNNNGIPGLHASVFDVAKKYAEKRFLESAEQTAKIGKIEVHKIAPTTKNLLIFNSQKLFDMEDITPYLSNLYKLSPEEIEEVRKNTLSIDEQQEVQNAFKVIASSTSFSKIMPELVESKEDAKILKDLKNICEKNKKIEKPFVLDDDLETYVRKASKGNIEVEDRIREISGALNVFQMLAENGDIKTLISKLQSDFDFTEDMTLNLKFFKEFLRKENIVGVKQTIWTSEVIGQKNFDDYFFFDTQSVNSQSAIKKVEKDKQKQSALNPLKA